MKTHLVPVNDIDRKWYVVDAEEMILGRLASEIATRLRGKHKPIYSTFMDTGDFVVVLNAGKVKLTGNKWDDKVYYRHTGHIGGLKQETASELRDSKPEELIIRAVKGMLPKNSLGRKQLKKLKVYSGTEHPHSAQQPEALKL
ncbi:MAG TPA: 50S ribosomal protein L13 [Desulfurivibrio alkaliphilus]|uniref:Large ribosomal subunit protein uL13 n=1 Tax=Desulfurivibrio alkaliphilus TaxID=427923 RepID=A0A7C2XG99_9BACT|nr:50S ribosomal protein L13 [Desulfurivibrio alkaliphilus]